MGWIDLVESPRRVVVPSQPEANTVVSFSYSNSVRSRCTHAHCVVGDMRRQEESTSSRQIGIGRPRLGYHNLEEVTSGHPTWFNLEL